jgi:hypothetical protein
VLRYTWNLRTIKHDVWGMLLQAHAEVPALRQAIIDGKVDGSTYSGECACLPILQRDVIRPRRLPSLVASIPRIEAGPWLQELGNPGYRQGDEVRRKRALRRVIGAFCRLGVQSPNWKWLQLLGLIANKFARRTNGLGQGGGESGIRTHGTVSRTHAFQACALSHSAISPDALS